MLASTLVAASAAVAFFLGTMHLMFTFASNKFSPRDAALEARMKAVSPVISGELSMWNAWIGFNATHSMSAMLFGAVYGYLALFQPALLFMPGFFAVLGLIMLVGYVVIGRLYWFSVPFRGVSLSLALYVAGFAVALSSA